MGGPGKSYYLGVDLGTTYTAAAVWRGGQVEVASLGNRAPSAPSVLSLRDDGQLLFGEAAEHRATSEPHRVAREFKRRVGDPTPLILDKTPFAADALMTKMMRWAVDSVSEAEGGPPGGITITHPANWGEYKQDLLRQALRAADLDEATLLTEPEAAAIHYAAQERVDPGSIVAVYDLGGGTFDAAVLKRTDEGWEIRGHPEGIERLGGVDFDEAVFRHVIDATGIADQLDSDDPALRSAVHRLRRDCVAAKEALSSDTDTSIPVLLPQFQSEVRLTRSEFEDMIRPTLRDTTAALDRALRSAEVAADDIHAVLLAGGSSRIPLVAQLISSELGRPVAVDAHPKHGVALGAAIVAAERQGAQDRNEEDRDEPAAAPGAGPGALLAALPGGGAGGSPDPVEEPIAAAEPVAHTEAADLPETEATEPPTTEIVGPAEPDIVPPPIVRPGPSQPSPAEVPAAAYSSPPRTAGDLPPVLADTPAPGSARRSPPVGALVAVAAVLLIIVVAVALVSNRDDDPSDQVSAGSGTDTTTTTTGTDLTVTDVIGLPVDDAVETLAADGFDVSVSPNPEPTTDSSLGGTVASQDPSEGTAVSSDDLQVELIEYTYEPGDETTDDGYTETTTAPPTTEPHTPTTTEAPYPTTTEPHTPTTTEAPYPTTTAYPPPDSD